MTDKNNEVVYKFRKSLSNISKTQDGKVVLDFLKSCYVDNLVMNPETQDSIGLLQYRLGQKEFVQALIADAYASIEDLDKLYKENVNDRG